MNEHSIQQARRRGLSWLCCTCKKYWAARNAGISGDSCMAAVAGQLCGSPLSGLSFPLYEGEVTHPHRFCFVCGEPSEKGMKAVGSAKVFGVCRKHGPQWAAAHQSELEEVLPPEIYTNGDWVSVGDVPRKKSLIEHIVEFEGSQSDEDCSK